MENQKVQVVERLKQANNILVTVSSNPTVDQLAACIGLTLALNKAGKHATAVFSGNVPSTIEFLQPEKTIEKNTDSLQDFIIALDKSKADKLRYKVEDKVVKIFITPYRTSISQKDLQFSQGDFNVDVVLALGVHMQSDLDQAITSHGRILHDATVMSVNIAVGAELGSVNWIDAAASSLSELAVQVVNTLDQKLIDGQIATAFLTGIVAETDRFSNQRTSPQTMSISAQLMSAGANQQLVATKLEEPIAPPAPVLSPDEPFKEQPKMAVPSNDLPAVPPRPKDDGTIEITHNESPPVNEPAPVEDRATPTEDESQAPQIHIDDQGRLHPMDGLNAANVPTPPIPPLPSMAPPVPGTPDVSSLPALPPVPAPPIIKRDREDSSHMMTEPPTFETPPLTANAVPEDEDKPTEELGLPQVGLLNREPLPSQPSPQRNFPPAFDTPGATFTPSPAAPADLTSSVPTSNGSEPSLPELDIPGPAPSNLSTSTNPTPASPAFNPAPLAPPSPAPWTGPVPTNQPPALSAAPAEEAPKTLSQIEQDVNSPHLGSMATTPPSESGFISPAATPAPEAGKVTDSDTSVDSARDAVAQAINDSPAAGDTLGPIQALNAQPLSDGLHQSGPTNIEPPIIQPQQQAAPMVAPPLAPLPGQAPVIAPTAGTPPTVPPPMVPSTPSFPMNS